MIQEKHDFLWAVAQMKEGKKVRRKCWLNGAETSLNEGIDEENILFNFEDCTATDWEIVDEDSNWNLADNSGFDFGKDNFGEYADFVKDIKKCRDLLGEDAKREMARADSQFGIERHRYFYKKGIEYQREQELKRFGDLE